MSLESGDFGCFSRIRSELDIARELSEMSMLELFGLDARGQIRTLIAGLSALERTPNDARELELCMRAAHSLKGAARVVGVEECARIAHALEDGFAAAQHDPQGLDRLQADALRRGVELLGRLLNPAEPSDLRLASHRVTPLTEVLALLRGAHEDAVAALDGLRDTLPDELASNDAALAQARRALAALQADAAGQLEQLAIFEGPGAPVERGDAERIIRLRPFAEAAATYAPFVANLARGLGKQVRLEVAGAETSLDRYVVARLDAPLRQLLSNAVEDGIEGESERRSAGKPAEGRVTLRALEAGGKLQLVVADDGSGIDVERVRRTVVQRGLTTAAIARTLPEAALFEFMFLPGFTTKRQAAHRSGAGIGLNGVHATVTQLGGTISVRSQPGAGTRFVLAFPSSIAVVSALVADVGGERRAFPLSGVVAALDLRRGDVEAVDGRHQFTYAGTRIGLASMQEPLRASDEPLAAVMRVVVLGAPANRHGLLVDRILGVRELVVQSHEAQLGIVEEADAETVATGESPIVIVDIDDLLRAFQKCGDSRPNGRRILVVDDSLSVREIERHVLEEAGYAVDVCVDGSDAWEALHSIHYDLLISDTHMPNMGGIELIARVKNDARLRSMPAIIVSSSDREEDRRRGMEAGADDVLGKSNIYDATLLRRVADLIASPGSALQPVPKAFRRPATGSSFADPPAAAWAEVGQPTPTYQIVVLLVDDQPIVAEAVRRAFVGQKNMTLHFCSRAADAQETALRIKPTVILQDLMMPDADGLTLVRGYRAHESTKDIPIIVLSSREDPRIKSEAFSVGANDYLVKLPETIELVARIRYHSLAYLSHLQRHEAHNALRESQKLLLQKNLELERLTSIDVVTGLSNRRYFNDFATLHWKQAIREGSVVSILMIDVDDFKGYNDTYGHVAGDNVLKRIGDTLSAECRRPMDLPARFGGEEFVVFILAPTHGAYFEGERLRVAVANAAIPHSKSTAAGIVTISVGGASMIPRQGDSVIALVELADAALYDAKRLGKNRVAVNEHGSANRNSSAVVELPPADLNVS